MLELYISCERKLIFVEPQHIHDTLRTDRQELLEKNIYQEFVD